MKLVGVTAYGINIKNEDNKNLELHDIYGNTLLEYFFNIANRTVDEYAKDVALENIFAYNVVDFQTIKNVNGQDIYEVLYNGIVI